MPSYIKKNQWPILVVNAMLLLAFGIYYVTAQNYEFLLYIVVILFFFSLIILTNPKINYSNGVLWGLTFWGLLHMAGGSVIVNDQKLYELILIPISEQYSIFRFDQFVHMVGFGVATVVMFEILKPLLPSSIKHWGALSIVLVMAGLGVGGFNEIVEFIATVITPETGVGGYINTSLDLVSNFIGAIIAVVIIRWKEK